ncbi:MAG: trehalose-phosphatase [Vicinamibacterales bacterium]
MNHFLGPQFSDVPLWRGAFDAVVFDLDGVLTRTAALHAAAWKQTFDEFLNQRKQPGQRPVVFDLDADYRRFVDGRPRSAGAASFLESRGIHLPFGTAQDPPGDDTVWGLSNRKRDHFLRLLQERGADVDHGAVALVGAARDVSMRTAVVSSSRNCRSILEAGGLTRLFDVVLDGNDADARALRGKPEPDTFLEAARRLGVDPARVIVLEDAIAGIEAGRRAGFGCVIGVDRGERSASLRLAGAHLVVTDIANVSVTQSAPLALRHTQMLPSALTHVDELAGQIAGRRPALFLDYDGTLTPIVSRPQDARLAESTRTTILNVAARMPVTIISGRDLTAVQSLLSLPGLTYAGSHGFEIVGPGGVRLDDGPGERFLAALDRAEEALRSRLAAIPGAVVERKHYTIAVHFRNVDPGAATDVANVVDEVGRQQTTLRRTSGKMVFELQPDIEWHKGMAVLHVLSLLARSGKRWVPIYIGDDITDEDAFRAVAVEGVPIIVREELRPTLAHYAVESTAEVSAFLDTLAAAVGPGALS